MYRLNRITSSHIGRSITSSNVQFDRTKLQESLVPSVELRFTYRIAKPPYRVESKNTCARNKQPTLNI